MTAQGTIVKGPQGLAHKAAHNSTPLEAGKKAQGRGCNDHPKMDKRGVKQTVAVPIEARPSSAIGAKALKAFSWSGMAGIVAGSSPKVEA